MVSIQQAIQASFQQKQREGFVGKGLIKEVIKETAKSYKQDFPDGGNLLTAIGFIDLVSCICQEAQDLGISISKEEAAKEMAKGFLQT